MKKFIKKLKYRCLWTFSRPVLDAINSGATYDEVDRFVLDMLED